MTLALLVLPLLVLAILLKIFPAWDLPKRALGGEAVPSA